MSDPTRRLARLDVNLLVTLDALLAERSVTRAARRLHLSQPAVSVQLGKLRHALQDPLLVAGPRGMLPTALAAALESPLRDALERLAQVIAPVQPFDPATAQLTWRLAASDYIEQAVVLPLLPGLRRAVPHGRLAVVAAQPLRLARQAEDGEIDLAVVAQENAPAGLRSRRLYAERYVLAGREDHPALRRKPALSRFCKLDFVVVSPDGGGFRGITDTLLESMGLQRRVVLSVPHFLFVRSVLARTDLVAMLPERVARSAPGLRVVESPMDLPGFDVTMVWHERVHRDPAQVWLRERLAQASTDMASSRA